MGIDHLSLSTTPVVLLKGDAEMSQGTGFFYVGKYGEAQVVFLVTNYHVLTGHAPLEAKPPIGDNIVFQFHKSHDNPAEIQTVRMPLFTTESKPVWVQSASVPEADLAVIPIPADAFADCKLACISKEWTTEAKIKLRPTSAVTLIGYPYGYFDRTNALPIWKTGSLASEPDVDFDGKPLLTVDISAFPGMSGSPAFAISYGMYETEDGGTSVGGARKFVGVYASMQMLNEKKFLEEIHGSPQYGIALSQSLQLGHVWKARLVDEVVSSVNIQKWEAEIGAKLG
ncbi:MAG: hypothetical protein BVN29_08270 [Nitrospira sp. ST-bin5]|nr:MAG: hypothetical protein BVN29_08270 [Nitrospira sp. ST-bin5]